jgi:hypothetical protein
MSAAGPSSGVPPVTTGRAITVAPPRLAVPVALIVLGLAAAVKGILVAPARAWSNILVDGFYVLSISVSGLFFITATRLANARWSAALRRIPEASALVLPVASLLMLPIMLFSSARQTLFPWSRPGAFNYTPALGSVIGGKAQYLAPSFVYPRVVIVLGGFVLFAWLFRRASLAQDRTPGGAIRFHQRLNVYSGMYLIFFVLGLSTLAFDWIASLDPSWFSTMFAVYVFAGTFVSGNALVALTSAHLKRGGLLHESVGVGEAQLHDLGKMMFAFSIFWAYIWVSQYLLIWYGNIPEEVSHFVSRTNGTWVVLFGINVIINWVIPFLALMSVGAKKDPRRLMLIAGVLLVGHWLDLYLLVVPAVSPEPHLGLYELLIAGGYGGLFYLLFRWNLAGAPLVPLNDPVLGYDLAPISGHGHGHIVAHTHAHAPIPDRGQP